MMIIIIIIIIICNEKEGNKKSEIKPKKRQVMHNAIAHHLLRSLLKSLTP